MTTGVSITVVLEADFSDGLSQLPNADLVWLNASQVNCEALRNLSSERRALITTFSTISIDKQVMLEAALELIEDHHNDFSEAGRWMKLRLIGMRFTSDARTLLEECGVRSIEHVGDEIHASRAEAKSD